MARDRLSIHIEDGQPEVREALTILRNGGTLAQSGLVGITNNAYDPILDCSGVLLPLTIFNVQATGDCDVRFSSGPSYRSSLEILGNGNNRASGLHISYDPLLDDAFVDPDHGTGDSCVSFGAVDNTVADFSLIRASGTTGIEFGHISMSERGYVGIGITKIGNDRKFTPVSPLTIAYSCDQYTDSGTMAMRAQATAPSGDVGYGKLFVMPYTIGSRSHAVFFMDASGNQSNLVSSQDLDPANTSDGLIWSVNGNTFGGFGTPRLRSNEALQAHVSNTWFGWGVGYTTTPDNKNAVLNNTMMGYRTGSGLAAGYAHYNTVVGCNSLINQGSAYRNVIFGDDILIGDPGAELNNVSDSILIGRDLFNSSLPVDGTLAIGVGENPVIEGQIIGGSKYVAITDANFIVSNRGNSDLVIRHEFEPGFSRYKAICDIIDFSQGGSDYGENSFEVRFSNEDDLNLTLFKIDPRGGLLPNSPNYEAPAALTPFAQLEADFKLGGAIRFQDGTSMSGVSYFDFLPTAGTSGVAKTYQGTNNTNYFVLNFSELDLAANVAGSIRTDNTFVAVQLDGTSSSNMGKMSLQGFADYVSSGTASIGENCNVLISNPENELKVSTAANASCVMIGCDVATAATGWKNSIMIGSQAGGNATAINDVDLLIDSSVIFMGTQAGYECDSVANIIGIGTNAAKNARSSSDSVFIGSNAGLDATYGESIGIGENALRGETGVIEGGAGNIEIVCNLLDNQRLMFAAGSLSKRLNIQNTIAGRTDRRNISIGDARLSPTAPLEVRRDSIIHGENPNNYIQTWYCDDTLVASLDCDGVFSSDNSSLFVEGIIDSPITVAANINSPTTTTLSVYVAGVDSGDNVTLTNRDASLSATSSSYVVAIKIGSEYRPVWVSC